MKNQKDCFQTVRYLISNGIDITRKNISALADDYRLTPEEVQAQIAKAKRVIKK